MSYKIAFKKSVARDLKKIDSDQVEWRKIIYPKFFSEFGREKVVSVAGLHMVSEGIPAVVLRPGDDDGPQGIEIYVGQTVYEGLPRSILRRRRAQRIWLGKAKS